MQLFQVGLVFVILIKINVCLRFVRWVLIFPLFVFPQFDDFFIISSRPEDNRVSEFDDSFFIDENVAFGYALMGDIVQIECL